MPIFEYKARDKEGKTKIGTVEAPSEGVAQEIIKDQSLILIGLSERKKKTFLQSSIGIFNRVSTRDMVIFSRQLAVMISATVPITKALRILVKQTENISFKIVISEIADEVDGGAKLSNSMARYPQVFSQFYIHMIRSGETSGKLDEILNYLADQTEKDYDLMNKIRSATIYPIFILVGIIGVAIVAMVYVIPKLTAVLLESGAELPLSTRILIGTSDFLTNQWWVVLLISIGAAVFFRSWYRTKAGRFQVDKFKLRAPILGKIFKRIYLTRFSRSLANLLSSGIPLIRAMEIVKDIVGNTIYQALIAKTIKEIEDGNPISTVFVNSKDVPVMLTQMLNIGEQTGRLDYILSKLADFYAKEVETAVQNLVTLIEPIVMIIMGVGVAILVSAILMPMYNMSSAF
ncbi:MAG: type II secretion system F family protein [Patescibacteria group bacterium]